MRWGCFNPVLAAILVAKQGPAKAAAAISLPLLLPLRLLRPFRPVPPAPPADPTRIGRASNRAVNYWCQALNCTETRLRNAVLAVGPLAADVRAYLTR